MIPIHAIPAQHDKDSPPAPIPDDRLCYLVGRNGLFKQVRNDFYSARVKVDGAGNLAEIEAIAKVHVPVLPLTLLQQAEAFFCAVFKKHESEAVVLLQVNPASKVWRIEVPPQVAQGLHVRYDLSALPAPAEGFERFGTIHSHANIQAFHSGTDDDDELGFDGLHITIGNVNKSVRTYSARWMLAGKEFKVDLEDVVEAPAPQEFDLDWMDRVQHKHATQPFANSDDRRWSSTPDRDFKLSDPECLLPYDSEGFPSVEAYEGYLLAMRDEIDERLMETSAQFEQSETKKEASPCDLSNIST